ncbi:actin-like ATPase domain-containing protein [Basidiobolus meristosporus CBS 931.73]|uniref:Xylulose kinase n=1 Tax=Basidiobolus meristosporus CBS 931.73 TaxID=1314790 RepID=A0A1Y1XS72_9FUNG|nr:actin-like ATPase domain-containing protein [Basidiobolus meristosporus CBS 931.73]|eukprot:ORX88535.1 actin-like ATPase domain-containing protein [Basidiobolus meristosporus CBS 931.73]
MTELLPDVFLGLDLSTQQLKATITDQEARVVLESSVSFDEELPEFNTRGGVLVGENGRVTAPVQMWVKAVDLLLQKLKDTQVDLGHVRAISGAAQQHGTVYWSKQSLGFGERLVPEKPLHEQLSNAFALEASPIWQDTSTTQQCRALEKQTAGAQNLADISGSKAYERFSGNQIAKIYQDDRTIYQNTQRISLVSSFLASLFLGTYAPIDVSDGSGMNLLNIWRREWEPSLLGCCAPNLESKLGKEVVEDGTPLGPVHSYFARRYGFREDLIVVNFTGDNPATLLSMNISEGGAVVSLGTSDTVLMHLNHPNPSLFASILCHPSQSGSHMGLICYSNGSLTRQFVRDKYANGSWEEFNASVRQTPPGCNGRMGFYGSSSEDSIRIEGDSVVSEFSDPIYNTRAVLESRFLSMHLRCMQLGLRTKRVFAVGGAASNDTILQVLADVFGVPVYKFSSGNSASQGACYLAQLGFLRASDPSTTFNDLRIKDTSQLSKQPNAPVHEMYCSSLEKFSEASKKWGGIELS